MLLNNAITSFLEYLTIINRSEQTIHGYQKDLNQLLQFMEQKYNCPIYFQDVTLKDLEDFLTYLGSVKKLSARSISRVLYALRSFYNYGIDKRELGSKNIARIIETVKLPYKERIYLKEQEISQLIACMDNRLIRLIVQTLYLTGMRISECLALRVQDVELNQEVKVIHVRNGKGAKDRSIPINNKLFHLLMDYKKNWRPKTGSDYFFCTRRTGKVSPVYVNQIIRETAIKLKWSKQVSAHILRHSFATSLIKKGVDLPTIQKILGHSNLKVTSIYCHTDLAQMQHAVQSLQI